MLTDKGWRQHVDLGACIRKKYIDVSIALLPRLHLHSCVSAFAQPVHYIFQELKLLSPVVTAGEVYVRSTDYPRTMRSAEAQIEGLYPPGNRHPLLCRVLYRNPCFRPSLVVALAEMS